jgi:hypothetical protein
MEEKQEHKVNLQTRTFKLSDGRDLEVSGEDQEYIFKGMRPRLMSREDFKIIQRHLKKELAQYLKGELVHVSKVSDAMWENYTKDIQHKYKQRGFTYVKKKDSTSGDADNKQ